MTGKFTQNVHDLGHATGRILHRLLLSAASDDGIVHSIPESLGDLARVGVDIASLPSSVPLALSSLSDFLLHLPHRYGTWWLGLLRSDPLHVLVETLLIVMCVALVVLQRRADWKFNQERKNGSLTEEEEEELLREWKADRRKPLGGGGRERMIGGGKRSNIGLGTGLVVEKIEGSRLYFESRTANDDSSQSTGGATDGSEYGANKIPASALNFATLDYLSAAASSALRTVARDALAYYGCGSCGPRGFYGTIDAHLEAEEAVSKFLGTEGAILYSDGASAATSTVAAFAKRGDLLIVDEGVNEALLVGVTLSRANVRYFRHNDANDLRRVLEKVRTQDKTLKRKPTDQRRFLVVEGLYRNWGTIAPLNDIVKLKEEFCYRLILDDSHGMGVLGATGRGSLEHAGLRPMVHCEILTFGLENALGSVGGMTVGSEEVVDHQRLSGAGYCFSASAPPFLSKVCMSSIRRLEGRSTEQTVNDLKIVASHEVDMEASECSDDEEQLIIDDGKEQSPCDSCSIPADNDVALNHNEELRGPPMLERLHQNTSDLYNTLTDSSHPHALKLRNHLCVTSDPISPLVYLRLTDVEATGRTRAEQTSVLDKIARRCLTDGEVAIVSTGGHVKKYLQLVPQPSLRLASRIGQTKQDVEVLVKALGEAVEGVLVYNDGNFVMD